MRKGSTGRIRLIHWHRGEAGERIRRLRVKGYTADFDFPFVPAVLRAIKSNPPDIIVIDLARLPSHGRDIAMAFRQSRATRFVPLVFVEGDPVKVEAIRKHLPDAVYTTWSRIGTALGKAVSHAPLNPVVPRSALAGYSGAPLVKKLGIKPGTTVNLVDPPPEFAEKLADLQNGITLHSGTRRGAKLTLWFVRTAAELTGQIRNITRTTGAGRLWIIWPKKTSMLASDLSQQIVRHSGLSEGLVDFKICAVDETWSGLLFKPRPLHHGKHHKS